MHFLDINSINNPLIKNIYTDIYNLNKTFPPFEQAFITTENGTLITNEDSSIFFVTETV